MSPGEILAAAQQSVATMVLSTVYRNIRALVGDGRVEAIVLPGQPDRYAAVTAAIAGAARRAMPAAAAAVSHRHYFQCRQCDRVFPLEGCPGHLDEITPPGFEVERHEITLMGRCAECVEGERSSSAGKQQKTGVRGGTARGPRRH